MRYTPIVIAAAATVSAQTLNGPLSTAGSVNSCLEANPADRPGVAGVVGDFTSLAAAMATNTALSASVASIISQYGTQWQDWAPAATATPAADSGTGMPVPAGPVMSAPPLPSGSVMPPPPPPPPPMSGTISAPPMPSGSASMLSSMVTSLISSASSQASSASRVAAASAAIYTGAAIPAAEAGAMGMVGAGILGLVMVL